MSAVLAIGLRELPHAFLVALGLTVVALGAVVATGAMRRRRTHYACVVAMAAALGWAIREAETLGRGLLFEGAASTVKDVHMVAVGLTFVLVPALVVTGIGLARGRERSRSPHRWLAVAFVVAVVVTCALGTAMTLLATPRDGNLQAAPESAPSEGPHATGSTIPAVGAAADG